MRKLIIALGTGTLLLAGVAFYFQGIHRYQIQIQEHFVQSPQIPAPFDGARLVQLSDLLIENNQDLSVLERVIEEVNALEPDMVALTGNVFGPGNVSAATMERTGELLASLEADIGKVAVLGSLDLAREEAVTEFLEDVNFHVLRNEAREFFNGTMSGVTFLGLDPASQGHNPDVLIPRIQQDGTFQIWLTHEGHQAASIVNHHIGLKLSGYCLGQSAPTVQCSQFPSGTYRFADQLVNVSAGVGASEGFFGFLKRPSIDSFLLIRQ